VESVLLGIDSGTSVVKSVVFDMQGNEIAVARRETPVLTRVPGGSEIDMLMVWELAAETIAEVMITIGDRHVAGVGICGTACGVWPMDAAGNPTREAILWNDGRAADVIDRWQADGFMDRVWAVSGNTMFPGYPLVALRWLTDHEPDVMARTRWLPFHKDWLRYKLTGALYSDESDVAYFPGDIHARGYSDALLNEAGLTAYREKLLPVARSQDVVASISPEAAAKTGLPAGTPVVAGAVDVVASALGGGAFRVGQACSILGTSFLNTLVTGAPTFEPPGTGVQACMPEGVWGRSLVNTTGTMGIDWMVKNFAEIERREASASGKSIYDLIEAQVSQVPAGSRGIIFLPYLNSAGIISPFVDPHARGQFFGLSTEHTRFDMMRAVYEGTALAMRDCYAVVPGTVEEVVLVGGGARSAFWAQMFADASGKRILIPGGTEFGARGAAILAGVGVGVFPTFEAAMEAFVRADRSYEPRPKLASVYTALYDLYRHLYQNAREGWKLRQKIVNRAN
jgi:sugar (pentulose or hexulose) kinase